jgi:hypothetical protein
MSARMPAGRQVSLPGISAQEDHFSMSAGTNPADALFELELMAAYFRDPGWRDETLVQVQSMVPLIFQQLQHQAVWPIMSEFLPAFHDDDPRMQVPTANDITDVRMDYIKAWVGP